MLYIEFPIVADLAAMNFKTIRPGNTNTVLDYNAEIASCIAAPTLTKSVFRVFRQCAVVEFQFAAMNIGNSFILRK